MRMKLLVMLILISAMQLTASVRGQNAQVSLKLKDATLVDFFKEVKSQTQFDFLYNHAEIISKAKLNIDVKDENLKGLLEKILYKRGLGFELIDDVVVISERKVVPKTIEQREIVIKGKVSDGKGVALPGVTVMIKGTQYGVSTDVDGNFELAINKMGDIMVFSFVGYKTKEITINSKDFLKVVLETETSKLDEVVVVGYGSVSRKDLTGTISSIHSNEIKGLPVVSVDAAMQGKAAGVQIIKADGSPGGAVKIKVRGGTSLMGGNDPLYIIDGIPMTVSNNYVSTGIEIVNPIESGGYGEDFNSGVSGSFLRGLNNLAGLNINDIQSIDILKDASATAIYGSKAANGVVIITTKRGHYDMKPQFDFNYYVGVTKPFKQDMLNASEFKTLMKEAAQNLQDARAAKGMPADANADAILNDPSYFGDSDTDWQDLVLRNSVIQNADFSVRGGSKTSRFYTSINVMKQDGAVIGTDFNRITGKVRLDNDLSKRVRVSTNIDLSYSKSNITNSVYGQALTARPDYSPYNADGTYTSFDDIGYSHEGFQNPLAMTEVTNQGKDYQLLASISGEFDLTDDIKFKSTVSTTLDMYYQTNFVPSFVFLGGFYGNTDSEGGTGSESSRKSIRTLFENTLTWNKEFNENNRMNVLVGTSFEKYESDFFSADGKTYPDDYSMNNLSSAAYAVAVGGGNSSNALLSFYARLNYVHKDKYYATFTGRADASSKFAEDNQYGFFPSGALAWRISEEDFMKSVGWVDELKIKASAGLVGTQNIGDNMWRTLFHPVTYGGKNALVPDQLGNADIKWESTLQYDAGMEFGLFDNRLSGSMGYYMKETKDLLLNISVAPSSGFPSLVTNIATIENQGLELELNGVVIDKPDFKWNVAFNIARNRSKVVDIQGGEFSDPNDREALNLGTSVVREGEQLGLLWGRVVKGILKDQAAVDAYKEKSWAIPYFQRYLGVGDYEYEFDETGWYKEDVIGNASPDFFGGLTNTFTYKDFSLSALFTYSYGNDLMYQNDVNNTNFKRPTNKGDVILDRWHSGNQETSRPRLVYGQTTFLTNMNVYDASYIKLKSLTLNYNIPQSILSKLKIRSASLYATATNLFTITDYPGLDPEVSDNPNSIIGGGRDIDSYPTGRTFTFGVRLGF